MIKDTAENARAMRLKITFTLNHTKNVSEDSFLGKRERKVCIIYILFYLLMQKMTGKRLERKK